ncbi:hypothetical protein BO94DRAFT_479149 [Aspergillus sclerotioniger CBS 115572]|uniref:Zn(2)-C6 fungal-type domain-containing protein n=1 Tax=Aspergillus sclerotioniger CBS 115572 TaxID=1450535 RepID=A0A317UZB7_9EURO|nr:hypothetical protein BO94DRAFT_479149 [Aspergillus sclerotioniger CBS 115572]PWY67125.1 hypothetical protein BO94DRAFT_479149 [Aspergillus sclerotioniger CBS 115572]
MDDRPSQSPAAPPSPNPRSCILCNRRKVRCDRQVPCGRCVKGGEKCVFPGPKRAPRQLKRPPISEVLAQLRHLEDEVQKLRTHPPAADSGSAASSSPLGFPAERGPVGPSNQEGRLVIKENKSRYIGDEASAVLGDKIRELQDICDGSSSDDESDVPELTSLQFVGALGGNWRDHSLRDNYLQPARIQLLWRVYQNNVAPLIAVLHTPSVEVMVRQEADNINPDPAREALILAVCFAAIVSLPPDQCPAILGLDYDRALQSYRRGVDQALVRANFIKSQNICVLQAAVVFLLSLRYRSDSRLVWAASGVVVRVAQGQGVHRDGQALGLSPFDAEMRRRLWWHICVLDMISSEDQGTDTQIHPGMFDTRLPSNIDVRDLSPSLTELPPERIGATDITLAIVQCEIISKLHWSNRSYDANDPASTSDRETIVTTLANALEERYLQHLNMDVPIEWVYAMIVRLTLSKIWLSVHYRDLAGMGQTGLSQEACDDAFEAAIETVKFTILLHTNETTSQWAWLCKSYKQWHPVAFILAELCTRPITVQTNHAWDMVTEIHGQWEQDESQTSIMLRKPLKRLMERAAVARAAKMEVSPSLGTLHTAIDPALESSIPIGPETGIKSDMYSIDEFGISGMNWIWEPLM